MNIIRVYVPNLPVSKNFETLCPGVTGLFGLEILCPNYEVLILSIDLHSANEVYGMLGGKTFLAL